MEWQELCDESFAYCMAFLVPHTLLRFFFEQGRNHLLRSSSLAKKDHPLPGRLRFSIPFACPRHYKLGSQYPYRVLAFWNFNSQHAAGPEERVSVRTRWKVMLAFLSGSREYCLCLSTQGLPCYHPHWLRPSTGCSLGHPDTLNSKTLLENIAINAR